MAFQETGYHPYDFANRRHIGPSPAEIASSVFMGSYQDYVLSAHGQTLLIIDSDPANHETFDAGEKVFLGIAPNKLHIVK